MDRLSNPYTPGAGYPPPELAGRDEIIDKAAIVLARVKAGRAARSLIFYGLRGVGKTVLLNKIGAGAMEDGLATVTIETPEKRSLPRMLAPALRTALLRLSGGKRVQQKAQRALQALGNFVEAMRVKYSDMEFRFDFGGEKGLADSGDLETDVADLLVAVGEAASEQQTAAILLIDELQYVAEAELAALLRAFHLLAQKQLPVIMIGAGLPQILGQSGKAKSYAERLFEFIPVDRLDEASARRALCKPAEKEGVTFAEDAISAILERTLGYPYFLQEWGKHSWNIAVSSPIRREDVLQATEEALKELDQSFFRVRFDRLTPAEKRYVRAMAELGPGPHRSGDIAEVLMKGVSLVAPTRNNLIKKGMIYSRAHGDNAFTVPLFDQFLKRSMPELNNSSKT